MKTIAITGGSSGIGKAIAIELAKENNKVIIVNRQSPETSTIIEELKQLSNNKEIYLEVCDLSSLKQVQNLALNLADKYSGIDVLINNAGIELMERTLTEEGLEMVFTVNYLAPFLLTNLLIDKLPKKKQLRIINTTSLVEKWGKIDFDNLQSEKKYDGEKTYYNSKLALLLFTYELASRLPANVLTSNCYEPGLTKTNFTRNFKGFAKFMSKVMSFFMKTPEEAAKTPVYLAISDDVRDNTGKCFYNKKEKTTSNQSYNKELAVKLWRKTEEIINSVIAGQ